MKFSTVIAPLLLGAVSAAPTWNNWGNGLSDADAQYIIDQEIVYLQHLDIAAGRAAAESIFAEDIVEYGDSINSLRGAPLGTIVENGRESYINDTLSTPSIPQIDTLSVVHNSRDISWQWRFYGIGPPTAPNPYIQGWTLIKTNEDKKVYYHYVEFNSLAWAENSGFTVTPPTEGPFAPE